MSQPHWQWDDVRRQYYCWSADTQCYVLQDGTRLNALGQAQYEAGPATSTEWQWNTLRQEYYRWSEENQSFVLQNGDRIDDPSPTTATADPSRPRTVPESQELPAARESGTPRCPRGDDSVSGRRDHDNLSSSYPSDNYQVTASISETPLSTASPDLIQVHKEGSLEKGRFK
jgi:hypothetical protein